MWPTCNPSEGCRPPHMRAQRSRSQRCHVAAARAPRGSRRQLVQPETLPPLPAGGGGSAAAARGRRFFVRENSWCQLAGDHGAGRECGKNVVPRVRVPQAVLPPRKRDNAWRGFACTSQPRGGSCRFYVPRRLATDWRRRTKLWASPRPPPWRKAASSDASSVCSAEVSWTG